MWQQEDLTYLKLTLLYSYLHLEILTVLSIDLEEQQERVEMANALPFIQIVKVMT